MLTMGIDIGSTTSKCVLLENGTTVVGQALVKAGIGTDGPEEAWRQALSEAGASEGEIAFRMATGYGRARWPGADGEISELTAHAIGCRLLQPDARTVIDIGGQDAKVIVLSEDGRMDHFVMNDKCAAGTGRFLDVMAGILRLDLAELGDTAARGTNPAVISSTCTVFAESEVISQLAMGAAVPDVVAGICASVAVRVAALARRAGVRERVYMTGGVAWNEGVRRCLAQSLGVEVRRAQLPQLCGALGAAASAHQKVRRN